VRVTFGTVWPVEGVVTMGCLLQRAQEHKRRTVIPVLALACLAAACGGDDADADSTTTSESAGSATEADITAFCEVAQSSNENREQAEIDVFYAELEAVAPDEISDAVATLKADWNNVSFPFGQEDLSPSDISRPAEVSAAARLVFDYVAEVCGPDAGSGVYLIFPEAGF